MTIGAWRYGVAAALVLGLLSVTGGSESFVQGQGCAVTVQPGESIQRAIDAAQEGAVICLSAGTWEENVVIAKSIALRGAGREQTKIKGKESFKDVISINSDAEIEVVLEGLTAAEARDAYGIVVWGKAKVAITASQISGNGYDGIAMGASAQATITNSQISDNEWRGIWMASAQATISNSQISGNGYDGIVMGGLAQATITDSQISDNELAGIFMWASAQATISTSTIEGNGTNELCKEKEYICNGIVVYEQSQVKLIGAKILTNADWGVGALLKQCGYGGNAFTGAVTFEQMELENISGNNTTGNQNGMGNPGNHPFKNLPDGQVCLP